MVMPNMLQNKIDRTLFLLFFGMVFFVFVLIFVEYFFKDDGQMFQVISGLVTGFAGAFFGRMKPQGEADKTGVHAQIDIPGPVVAAPEITPDKEVTK